MSVDYGLVQSPRHHGAMRGFFPSSLCFPTVLNVIVILYIFKDILIKKQG